MKIRSRLFSVLHGQAFQVKINLCGNVTIMGHSQSTVPTPLIVGEKEIDSMWAKLWKMKLHDRLKIFLWRIRGWGGADESINCNKDKWCGY